MGVFVSRSFNKTIVLDSKCGCLSGPTVSQTSVFRTRLFTSILILAIYITGLQGVTMVVLDIIEIFVEVVMSVFILFHCKRMPKKYTRV
eukprot:NODE_6657_length_496_cov_54.789709_g5871_i0.p2 GENE.NODE_6657_length_496_cov_54.789709_g5871_i0~~NODE_6657_length_496_cov_54.789709_g5871_i0.p2  ORF type:complete len:89 (+),score=12.20 NODE_6657_length_496_cov_54.789709_g5871_i0:96-362(+)